MSTIEELVNQGKYADAVGLPEAELHGRDLFLLVSAYLSLNKGKEAMEVLIRHREELFHTEPQLALKANFETRFLLNQYEEAAEDLEVFANYPYVSQAVEETLRELPKTIAAMRYASRPKGPGDLDELLSHLASPSDDLELLSTLNALKKVGDLEDYRGLVEEVLVGPYHDDVRTYALMLLSAKGSDHPVAFRKRGKDYEVVPSRLGSPYGLPEYRYLREKLQSEKDTALRDVAGELLDLHALICYPERFLSPGEEDAYAEGLLALAHSYLGIEEPKLEGKAAQYRAQIGKDIADNPPLLR